VREVGEEESMQVRPKRACSKAVGLWMRERRMRPFTIASACRAPISRVRAPRPFHTLFSSSMLRDGHCVRVLCV
jgi:hypothetical protein